MHTRFLLLALVLAAAAVASAHGHGGGRRAYDDAPKNAGARGDAAEEKVPVNAFPIALHSDTVVLAGEEAVNVTAGQAINIGIDTPVVRIDRDARLHVPFLKGGESLAGYKCQEEGEMKHNVPAGTPPEVCFCVLDDATSRLTWHCAILSK